MNELKDRYNSGEEFNVALPDIWYKYGKWSVVNVGSLIDMCAKHYTETQILDWKGYNNYWEALEHENGEIVRALTWSELKTILDNKQI